MSNTLLCLRVLVVDDKPLNHMGDCGSRSKDQGDHQAETPNNDQHARVIAHDRLPSVRPDVYRRSSVFVAVSNAHEWVAGLTPSLLR
jgi:hypothetical protein